MSTNPTTEIPAITTPQEGSESPPQRILVVESDCVLGGLHEGVLTIAGYETETAETTKEALEMLATGRFDTVVTEQDLPDSDGCELVRTLREGGSTIPVVMLSDSLATTELPGDVCREIAAALPKPVPMAEVVAAVSFALTGAATVEPPATETVGCA